MDHLPELIGDRCLAAAQAKVVSTALATTGSGIHFKTETITMPRNGSGLRPITLMPTTMRAVYNSLVTAIESSLPEPSRGPGKWPQFEEFGLSEAPLPKYIVSIDITAYYEYIDHRIMESELLLQTMDSSMSRAIIGMIDIMFPAGHGLPQMMESSDRLGDTYLSVMERGLSRSGRKVARFADDFRVAAVDWQTANDILEQASDLARSLGLVLSSEKSRIWKTQTLVDAREDVKSFLDAAFEEAKPDYSSEFGMYDDWDEDVDEPEEELNDPLIFAYMQILSEWCTSEDEHQNLRTKLLNKALSELGRASDRVSHDVLATISEREPLRLEAVCNYLLGRSEEVDANWDTLTRLVRVERQTPWTKIWLLTTAGRLHHDLVPRDAEAIQWVGRQVADRHESVRAEAAWCMAKMGIFSTEDAVNLYSLATSLTRPAIAAALGRHELGVQSATGKSICGDSPLSRSGYEWGATQDD